ncbi:hypothetical protein BH10PLA2_BH10PLA2_37860 [soil metagenome]
MAKSALERKHDQIRRNKARLRKSDDIAYPYLGTPFFEWLKDREDDWQDALFHLDACQMPHPHFDDDRGPQSIDGEVELIGWDDPTADYFAGYKGSVGRAESLVNELIAAAANFALSINKYKKEILKKKKEEIESSDLSDPETRKRAFDDVARIDSILKRLEKMRRINIYEFQLKEI